MKTLKSLSILSIMIFITTACSKQQIYYGLKESQKNECRKLIHQSEYEECMSQHRESYEQYEMKREDVLKK